MYLSLTTQQINGIGLSSSFLSLLRQSYDGIVYWMGRAGFIFVLAISMLILWPLAAILVFILKKFKNLEIELTNENLSRYWNLNIKLKNNLDAHQKMKNYDINNVPFLLRGVVSALKKTASLQVDIYHNIEKAFKALEIDTNNSIFTQISTKEIMDIRPSPYKYLA